jgi:hypothetical protein
MQCEIRHGGSGGLLFASRWMGGTIDCLLEEEKSAEVIELVLQPCQLQRVGVAVGSVGGHWPARRAHLPR